MTLCRTNSGVNEKVFVFSVPHITRSLTLLIPCVSGASARQLLSLLLATERCHTPWRASRPRPSQFASPPTSSPWWVAASAACDQVCVLRGILWVLLYALIAWNEHSRRFAARRRGSLGNPTVSQLVRPLILSLSTHQAKQLSRKSACTNPPQHY